MNASTRCPACRARLMQEPACPRCGCDLTLVRRAEAQARQLLVRAAHAYARGSGAETAALAGAALALEHSPLAAGLLWAGRDIEARKIDPISRQA